MITESVQRLRQEDRIHLIVSSDRIEPIDSVTATATAGPSPMSPSWLDAESCLVFPHCVVHITVFPFTQFSLMLYGRLSAFSALCHRTLTDYDMFDKTVMDVMWSLFLQTANFSSFILVASCYFFSASSVLFVQKFFVFSHI
jgi:hypothetical protein